MWPYGDQMFFSGLLVLAASGLFLTIEFLVRRFTSK